MLVAALCALGHGSADARARGPDDAVVAPTAPAASDPPDGARPPAEPPPAEPPAPADAAASTPAAPSPPAADADAAAAKAAKAADEELARMAAAGQAAAAKGGETIVVHGRSEATEREQSADAVTVVDTERAKRETADLGEVLARVRGVSIRRAGGLGSSARLSLGGFSSDQIRIFLDGLPLDLVGFPFGIANVPVNLVERIEIYSGVVPIRFGADALGGGVNLVTDRHVNGTHGSASYEVGSFGTNRLTLSGKHGDPSSGLFARVDGFFDRALNDYLVDVQVPDELGRLSRVRVPQFHDRYMAGGGALETGVVDRSWAKRLALRVFGTGSDKQYQANQTMQRVYGDVSYGERTAGATLRYEQPLAQGIALDATAGYTFTRGRFRDASTCFYDWYGRCVLETAPGEVNDMPHDQLSWEHNAFARLNASWRPSAVHELRVTVAPSYATRSGDDRRDNEPIDPLSAQRALTTIISGLEYQVDLLGDRLENFVFVKHYFQRQAAEDLTAGDGAPRRDRSTQRAGFGNSLRYRFAPWLYAKASYEWATRLPRTDEVFGDNAFIRASLGLQPESSHNANLGVTLDATRTSVGTFGGTVTGFARKASNLIELFGNTDDQTYQNVYGSRALGVEAAAVWTSPGGYLSLDGNTTYQDYRNDSPGGLFGAYDGDRIPNTPYLFANGTARFTLRDTVLADDEIVVSFGSHYVHSFFRTWESAGIRDQKQTIPAQLIHSLGVGYLVRHGGYRLSGTVELANLTDEAAFDYYGVQRPGRALYFKTLLDF